MMTFGTGRAADPTSSEMDKIAHIMSRFPFVATYIPVRSYVFFGCHPLLAPVGATESVVIATTCTVDVVAGPFIADGLADIKVWTQDIRYIRPRWPDKRRPLLHSPTNTFVLCSPPSSSTTTRMSSNDQRGSSVDEGDSKETPTRTSP